MINQTIETLKDELEQVLYLELDNSNWKVSKRKSSVDS